MNLSILKNFGLGESDLKIYQALISLGQSKTGPIIKSSKVTSSRVYESLNYLIDKGLVSYQVRNNIRYYKPELPNSLEEDLQNTQTELSKLTKEINNYKTQNTERNQTNVYEGKYGFKRAFVKHVEACHEGEELKIISFSPRFAQSRELRSFFRSLDTSVKVKKLKIKFLMDKKLKKTIGKDKQGIKNYTIRYMPSGYFNPSAINVSSHEVMMSVWGEQPIVFSIYNPIVVESFQQNFEYLWNRAK